MVAYADIVSALFRTIRVRKERGDILTENSHSLIVGRMVYLGTCCVLVLSMLLFLDMGRQWFCLGSIGVDMVSDLRAGFIHLRTLVLMLADNREIRT